MVETEKLVFNYTVIVTEKNIGLVKQLAYSTMVEAIPDEVEIGDEVPVEFTLEGDFSEHALTMAMLFNSTLQPRPYIRIERTIKKEKKKKGKDELYK